MSPIRTSLPQKLTLVALGLALAFITLEVGLRTAGAVWLWARGRENPSPLADDGATRVLCVGESTTALGGADSYPRQLERILNSWGGGRRFSVVNAGVPGITTDVVLARLPDLIDRYRPHLVVSMMGVNDSLILLDNRLPPFTAWRVRKLLHFFYVRLREAFEPDPRDVIADPTVVRYASLRRAGDKEAAEAVLRKGATGPDATDHAVFFYAVVLTGSARQAEARDLLERHLATRGSRAAPNLAPYLLRVRLTLAGRLITEGRLDEAERELALVAGADPRFVDLRTAALADLARVATLRGQPEQARKFEAEAERIGTEGPSTTALRYRDILRLLRQRGIPLVAVQYPLRPLTGLRALLDNPDDVVFVDNEAVFRQAVARKGDRALFSDRFAGDFGHFTPEGARLVAESVARAILAEATPPTGRQAPH
jgi:lysophospholipase L1-like esterase